MKCLVAAVQTFANPTLNVVDCLAAGQLLLRLAIDPQTPMEDRWLARRVGEQMVATADAAMMSAVRTAGVA